MALTRAQLVPSTWLSLFAENSPLSSLPPHCHTVTHTQGHVPLFPGSCSVLASPVVRSSFQAGWTTRMATSPQAATLDRKPGWPTGSGVLRWTSTRLIRQHTNQRTEPSRARTSSDLSSSASAPLLPAIPQGPASGPTLPNGEAVIMPPKTRGPSGRQVRTLEAWA